MAQTAANLVDSVLPKVPVRQWVLSLPFPLRIWAARRPKLRATVVGILLRVVRALLRRATGQRAGSIGAVCFHQYFGSSLNLNVHLHMLVLDGVYVTEQGEPEFVAAPRLSAEDVQGAVELVHRRVERMLRRRGLLDDPPEEDAEDGQVTILLARSFEVDALRCPGCHGRLTVRQIVRGVWVAGRLLKFLLPTPGHDNELFTAWPKPEPRQLA